MKVLILGAYGMLGQELVRVFKNNHQVIGWGRKDCDITDEQQIKKSIVDIHPDVLINAVAYNEVDGAEADKDSAKKVNGTAVGYLTAVSKHLGIPIVHYSTEYVFDGEKQEGYRENDTPNPISAYGKSKELGERLLRFHTDRFYLVRLSKLFGKAGTEGSKESFPAKIIKAAQEKRRLGLNQIEIFDSEFSLPTFAPDLAQHTLFLVEQRSPFGIYHSANSGEAVSWYGWAREIFRAIGEDIKLVPKVDTGDRPAKRPQFGKLLNTSKDSFIMRDWKPALAEFLQEEYKMADSNSSR